MSLPSMPGEVNARRRGSRQRTVSFSDVAEPRDEVESLRASDMLSGLWGWWWAERARERLSDAERWCVSVGKGREARFEAGADDAIVIASGLTSEMVAADHQHINRMRSHHTGSAKRRRGRPNETAQHGSRLKLKRGRGRC